MELGAVLSGVADIVVAVGVLLILTKVSDLIVKFKEMLK